MIGTARFLNFKGVGGIVIVHTSAARRSRSQKKGGLLEHENPNVGSSGVLSVESAAVCGATS